MPCTYPGSFPLQVYDELGDKIRVLKIDTDENPELSSQLQVGALSAVLLSCSMALSISIKPESTHGCQQNSADYVMIA